MSCLCCSRHNTLLGLSVALSYPWALVSSSTWLGTEIWGRFICTTWSGTNWRSLPLSPPTVHNCVTSFHHVIWFLHVSGRRRLGKWVSKPPIWASSVAQWVKVQAATKPDGMCLIPGTQVVERTDACKWSSNLQVWTMGCMHTPPPHTRVCMNVHVWIK